MIDAPSAGAVGATPPAPLFPKLAGAGLVKIDLRSHPGLPRPLLFWLGHHPTLHHFIIVHSTQLFRHRLQLPHLLPASSQTWLNLLGILYHRQKLLMSLELPSKTVVLNLVLQIIQKFIITSRPSLMENLIFFSSLSTVCAHLFFRVGRNGTTECLLVPGNSRDPILFLVTTNIICPAASGIGRVASRLLSLNLFAAVKHHNRVMASINQVWVAGAGTVFFGRVGVSLVLSPHTVPARANKLKVVSGASIFATFVMLVFLATQLTCLFVI